jgi:hypothetical protein
VADAPAKPAASTVAQAPVPQVEEPARPVAPTTTGPKAEQSRSRAEAPRALQALPTPQSTDTAPAPHAEQRETGNSVAARPALAPKAQTGDGEVAPPAKQGDTGTTVAAKPASKAPATDKQIERAPGQRGTGTADKAPASDKQIEQGAGQREPGTAVAAIPAVAAKASTSEGKVERGSEDSLIITFATNSSYFPSGAARRLRELIAGMTPDHKYQVALRVAVSGTAKVVGARSAQEAASYNKWLAERRLERVQNWLLENAAAEALSFKPEFVTDESRQVVVRLAPIG